MAKGEVYIAHPDIDVRIDNPDGIRRTTVMRFKNTAAIRYLLITLGMLESQMITQDENENCNPLYFTTEVL